MVLITSTLKAMAVALAASSVSALDCKQIGFVWEGYVGLGRTCEQTCADRAYYSQQAMARKGDPCIASDGLGPVAGVQVTSEKRCTNPNCPALVQCQCKWGNYLWRAYKGNRNGVSCNNFDIAIRLARNTPFAPVGWSNTKNDVHCS